MEMENEVFIEMPEESLESKIAGHQALINQLNRMIEVSDDEKMKAVFAQEIKNQEAEIEALRAEAATEE